MAETVDQKPFEMTLGDGTIVKGATIEEAFNTLAKMKVDTANSLKAERDRAAGLETEKQRYESELQKYKKPEPTGNQFSREKYYQMLNEDPMEAQNYMDRYRFGVDDPVNAFNSMRQQVDIFTQQSVAAAFTALHAEDYPSSPEANHAMRLKTEELLKAGHPFNTDTMELAYSSLVRTGTIKPIDKTAEEEITPPPSLQGAGGASASASAEMNEISKMEKMSTAELENYLKGKGVLR